MFVLNRKEQESVIVGGANGLERLLKVTVLEIGDGSVRLGFEVDPGVPVHGSELWQRLQVHGRHDRPWADPIASYVARN